MLTITVPAREGFDERTETFIQTKEQVLTLEHSLVSISKWESKWKKPFLSKKGKTRPETIDYIKCMTLTQNVDPNVYYFLTADNLKAIEEYVEDSMTATWFNDDDPNSNKSHEVITAEIIYYWMIAFNIPFECQKWHLNRLLTLIRVCNIKNAPAKKMSKNDIYIRNRNLNAARRRALNSRG